MSTPIERAAEAILNDFAFMLADDAERFALVGLTAALDRDALARVLSRIDDVPDSAWDVGGDRGVTISEYGRQRFLAQADAVIAHLTGEAS